MTFSTFHSALYLAVYLPHEMATFLGPYILRTFIIVLIWWKIKYLTHDEKNCHVNTASVPFPESICQATWEYNSAPLYFPFTIPFMHFLSNKKLPLLKIQYFLYTLYNSAEIQDKGTRTQSYISNLRWLVSIHKQQSS